MAQEKCRLCRKDIEPYDGVLVAICSCCTKKTEAPAPPPVYPSKPMNNQKTGQPYSDSDAMACYAFALGSIEPRTFCRFEGGRMVTYCFSIHRDRDGVVTYRSTPSRLSSAGWDDGSDFTQADYDDLITGKPRKYKGFWDRIFGA